MPILSHVGVSTHESFGCWTPVRKQVALTHGEGGNKTVSTRSPVLLCPCAMRELALREWGMVVLGMREVTPNEAQVSLGSYRNKWLLASSSSGARTSALQCLGKSHLFPCFRWKTCSNYKTEGFRHFPESAFMDIWNSSNKHTKESIRSQQLLTRYTYRWLNSSISKPCWLPTVKLPCKEFAWKGILKPSLTSVLEQKIFHVTQETANYLIQLAHKKNSMQQLTL